MLWWWSNLEQIADLGGLAVEANVETLLTEKELLWALIEIGLVTAITIIEEALLQNSMNKNSFGKGIGEKVVLIPNKIDWAITL